MNSQEFFTKQAEAGNFSKHIEKSIPGMGDLRLHSAAICNYITAGGTCGSVGDIGCSDGAMIQFLDLSADCKYYGSDTNLKMITKVMEIWKNYDHARFYRIKKDTEYPKVYVNICMFIMQFIGYSGKQDFFNRVVDATERGGYIIMAEKIRQQGMLAETSKYTLIKRKTENFTTADIVEKELFIGKSMPISDMDDLHDMFNNNGRVSDVSMFHLVSGFAGLLIKLD